MSLSQHKGFPLTQRLDGISIPGSESTFSASASSGDGHCVHGQHNKGRPGPLIFQKDERGNGIVSDALAPHGDSGEAAGEGSCRKFLWQLGVWSQVLTACCRNKPGVSALLVPAVS